MKIGYVRASKKEQNPELQRLELEAAGCERIFEESISSRKEDRPQLRAALDYCREGDALVVWKLDRLGRSLLISAQTSKPRSLAALCNRG